MDGWISFARAAAGGSWMFAVASCSVYDGGYGGYSGGGYYGGGSYGYPAQTSYYRGYAPYYASGYGTGYCQVCHRKSCTGHHDTHGEQHKSGNYDRGKVDARNLRVAGGDLDGKTKPKGEHSLDWYRDRGYNTGKLKLVDPDGDVYRRSGSKDHSRRDDDHDKSSHKNKH